MRKKNYYSMRKMQRENISKFNNLIGMDLKEMDLTTPFKFKNEACENNFNEWLTRFKDEWQNTNANINTNNALTQYNDFILNRLGYSECAFLATDSIINNAITKYQNEILRCGGVIKINGDFENKTEIKEALESRIKDLKLFEILREAIGTALTYGGALIFIDINTQDLSEPIYFKSEVFTKNKIQGLRVIPPYLCGASEVETTNPLNKDYMNPKQWFISGNLNTIHNSRLIPLVIFDSPLLLKPLFNFLGVSLCQFMKSYVASADIARQSLSDMLLRFKSEIIKSDLIKINPNEAVARAKAINRQKNNNSLILLTKDEEYVQSITALSGLDKLISQLYENVAVSARMPAVKLLGLTPSGFNATGDFDLNSYYDEIMSLQNSRIKPIIDNILKMLMLEFGFNNNAEYVFNPITKTSKLENAQVKNLEADFIAKNITSGIITQEQGLNYLKENELISDSLEYEAEADFLQGLNIE